MKQIKITIALIAACVLLYSCWYREDGHKYITFVNKSSSDLRCQEIWQGLITPEDTIYQCQNIPFHISADSLYYIQNAGYHGGWETDFKTISYLQLLIMDETIYLHYVNKFNFNCDSIRKYVPILHCYQLKLEDLQRMNWTVVYPPEE